MHVELVEHVHCPLRSSTVYCCIKVIRVNTANTYVGVWRNSFVSVKLFLISHLWRRHPRNMKSAIGVRLERDFCVLLSILPIEVSYHHWIWKQLIIVLHLLINLGDVKQGALNAVSKCFICSKRKLPDNLI